MKLHVKYILILIEYLYHSNNTQIKIISYTKTIVITFNWPIQYTKKSIDIHYNEIKTVLQ